MPRTERCEEGELNPLRDVSNEFGVRDSAELRGEGGDDGATETVVTATAVATRKAPRRGHVYFILAPATNRIKIGRAVDPLSRMSDLEGGSSEPLKMLLSYECDDMVAEESKLHREFARFRSHREWFDMDESIVARIESKKGTRPAVNRARTEALKVAAGKHRDRVAEPYVRRERGPEPMPFEQFVHEWMCATTHDYPSAFGMLRLVEHKPVGHVYMTEHMMWEHDEADENAQEFMRIGRIAGRRGTHHTAALLANAADEKERLAVWLAAAGHDIFESRDGSIPEPWRDGCAEWARHLTEDAEASLRTRSWWRPWHPMMTSAAPGLSIYRTPPFATARAFAGILRTALVETAAKFTRVSVLASGDDDERTRACRAAVNRLDDQYHAGAT